MTTENDWIKIDISDDMLKEAEENVKKYNNFNIFGGGYNQKLVGEIGRLALRKFLDKNKIVYEEDTHIGSKDEFDFIINGKNVSLKSQLLNFHCLTKYRCEVNEKQLNNSCDYYLFTKVCLKEKITLLVGCITKERFDKEGTLRKKGEILSDNFTSKPIKENKKDLTISDLDLIEKIYKK
ncbi:MAG: hypothetical protein PHD81_03450 [Candidatus Nanoarchaeia archaeon]|nr:hypothetical protein [Candidatus Nanoarchaeia archaeon]MDD5588140.1 hypothetical protein [Candidatus Nanoarchaeia archaeon]